ncbi:MAG: hypothetical protein JW866_06440, partial [Ignavibacteriales bacterium]|nr:hypothetical protein [Ignavibacteriales bacterium]
LILRFPKISFNLYYLGAGHTRDNIVIYIPDNKILFSGCMIKSLDSKNLGNITEGDLEEYPKTLDKLLKKFKEAQIVIPGHGNYGGLDLIHHTLKLIKNY